jgi:hypothetical protein
MRWKQELKFIIRRLILVAAPNESLTKRFASTWRWRSNETSRTECRQKMRDWPRDALSVAWRLRKRTAARCGGARRWNRYGRTCAMALE